MQPRSSLFRLLGNACLLAVVCGGVAACSSADAKKNGASSKSASAGEIETQPKTSAPADSKPEAAASPAAGLVGVWMEDSGAEGRTTSEFHTDGTYAGRFEFPPVAKSAPITFRGRWRLEGEFLVCEITESSDPEYQQLFAETRERILQILPDRVHYAAADDGALMTMRRVRATPEKGAKETGSEEKEDDVEPAKDATPPSTITPDTINAPASATGNRPAERK